MRSIGWRSTSSQRFTEVGGLWPGESIWVYGLFATGQYTDRGGIKDLWISPDGVTWQMVDTAEIRDELSADPCDGCHPVGVVGDTVFIRGNDFIWVGHYTP